jgi:hypothetical protein
LVQLLCMQAAADCMLLLLVVVLLQVCRLW